MFSDRLTEKEANYTEKILSELDSVEWAKRLVSRVNLGGGLTSENMPILFEARFAYELYKKGIQFEYEYPAGVGESTVEFRIEQPHEWLIELVSIRRSDGVKRATKQTGPFYEFTLTSNSTDPHQCEEAEMITAEQKIGEKVFTGGKATKFPPVSKAYHMIVTDMRGYLDQGGDIYDYRQMAYGASGLPKDKNMFIHFWEIQPGKKEPVKGLFETGNPLKSSKYIRKRIHFLGFIREKDFVEGEITEIAYYLGNPLLFNDDEKKMREAYKSYPLAKEIKW
jgi:hypothetical protein